MRSYSVLVLVLALALSSCSPFNPEELKENEEVSTESSPKELYVIRKVVYEIGILTDADNSTDFDNKTHEQIDVSFFDPQDNGSFVDLSNIPFPVETNVSGVALTGILPSNFGSLVFNNNGTVASLSESNLPVFPDKQVKITKNISTNDKEKSLNLLSGLSDILGLSKLAQNHDDEDATTPAE